MQASFVVMPGPKTPDGQPIMYLAFVQCDNEELIREVYTVAEIGTFCCAQIPRGVQPIGWQYTIKPPLAPYDYPGNLIFQIKRAKEYKRELPVSPKTEAHMA